MTATESDRQREFALEAWRKLRHAGYQAYWAGGCVRDQLLGRTPKDYDVATSATPEQVRQVFGPRRTLLVGAAFGVVAVVGPKGAGTLEVATFRRDGGYSDGRHPDRVEFCDPREDALRRDFTINGMFFDPERSEVVDYVGGRNDLSQGIIRAIGDPAQRFAEDKLRMLRAIRFAATFGFQIDSATWHAVEQMHAQIAVVSAERIAQEMRSMLEHHQRVRALELLRQSRLMDVVLPECLPMRGLLQEKPRQPGGDLWDHTLLVISELRDPSFTLVMAALLHDVGKPASQLFVRGKPAFYDHEMIGQNMAAQICRRWKLPNKELQRICWLVLHHMYLAQARQMRWSKLQRMLTSDGIEELLALHEADALASSRDLADVQYCRQLLAQPPEELSPPQLLSGHDLIRHGVPQGEIYKLLLEKVRDAQLERQIRSKREALELVDRLLASGWNGDPPEPQPNAEPQDQPPD